MLTKSITPTIKGELSGEEVHIIQKQISNKFHSVNNTEIGMKFIKD